ncbi:MAG TPA: glycoside hydrolase family 47 protein, partial [Gemmatimonadales bacterium]|nr:glycoside hydrolase family 47 protein [Gemmatimonadales bacterium]
QDQVQVASACLAAHQLTGDQHYLDIAVDLAAILETRYADSMGGYYDTVEPVLGDRTKHVLDDELPGANAAAARFLARLSTVTQDAVYRRRAQATLEAFAGAIPDAGLRATTFLAAARETLGAP